MKLRCQNAGGCMAPIACGGFGYCRERNFAEGVPPLPVQETWRRADQVREDAPRF